VRYLADSVEVQVLLLLEALVRLPPRELRGSDYKCSTGAVCASERNEGSSGELKSICKSAAV
jgi:hypothetical protein